MYNQHIENGMLIVVDGIDGTGKTSQVERFAASLREILDNEVITSREPTYGFHGKKARSAAVGEIEMSRNEELDCFLLDREEHARTLIEPAIDRSAIVVLDRYFFSTMAYQSRDGLWTPAELLESNKQRFRWPDFTFILDVPVVVALRRVGVRHERGQAVEVYEKKETLQHCREVFLSVAGMPGVNIVSAVEDQDRVAEMMLQTFCDRYCIRTT